MFIFIFDWPRFKFCPFKEHKDSFFTGVAFLPSATKRSLLEEFHTLLTPSLFLVFLHGSKPDRIAHSQVNPPVEREQKLHCWQQKKKITSFPAARWRLKHIRVPDVNIKLNLATVCEYMVLHATLHCRRSHEKKKSLQYVLIYSNLVCKIYIYFPTCLFRNPASCARLPENI